MLWVLNILIQPLVARNGSAAPSSYCIRDHVVMRNCGGYDADIMRNHERLHCSNGADCIFCMVIDKLI